MRCIRLISRLVLLALLVLTSVLPLDPRQSSVGAQPRVTGQGEQADLEVVLGDNSDPPSGIFGYHIVNHGPATARNVVVSTATLENTDFDFVEAYALPDSSIRCTTPPLHGRGPIVVELGDLPSGSLAGVNIALFFSGPPLTTF